jgi:S-adenosylmethionine hydrolase
MPVSRFEDEGLVAEVLWVDRFGNLQLNVDPDDVEEWGDRIRLRFGGNQRTAKRVGGYADLAAGEVGLVVDSYGLLSIALDRMSAAELLDLGAGDEVILSQFEGGDVPASPIHLRRA